MTTTASAFGSVFLVTLVDGPNSRLSEEPMPVWQTLPHGRADG